MRKPDVSSVSHLRSNSRRSTPRPVFVLALGRALVLLLALSLWAPSAHAQFPRAILPSRDVTEIFTKANNIYEYGREARNYEDSLRALRASIPIYKEFLIAAPGHELAQKARYRLGMSQLLTGNLVAAEASFETIIRRYRTGHYVATAAYRIAAQHYNAGAWGKASPYFQTAADQADKPDLRHKSHYYLARCLILNNQSAAAIKTLEKMISDQTNPFRDYARLAVGQIYASNNRHKDALEQFELLLSHHTAPQERAQALLAAGVSATALHDQPRAQRYLNETINTPGLDQKFKARAQLSLMRLRFLQKDYAETVRLLGRGSFIGDDATTSEIYMLAGRAYAQLNRHHEAIRYFFNAQRLSTASNLGFEASYRRLLSFYRIDDDKVPSQVDAFIELYGDLETDKTWVEEAKFMKAESLLHQSSLNRAAAAYEAVNPNLLPPNLRADLLFKRGWTLASTSDHNSAVQSLSSFINQYPEHPRLSYALARRGFSYLQLGDRASALKDFDRVLASGPDPELAAYAQQNTGRIFREDRNYKELIERYTALLESNPELPHYATANANYWIAWAWYKLEDYKKCLPHFEKARSLVVTLYREPAGTHLMLAAYSLKDPVLLKKYVDRLLDDIPGKILPINMLTWLGLQMFQRGDYTSTDNYLTLASTPDDPSYTDLIVWRHLAKARIEMRHFDRAMATIPIMIERETREFWKADAHLDQSHALIGLEKWEEARKAAHDGLELNPAGAVKAGLHMSLGEIAMNRKDYESAAASFLRTADLFIDDTQIKPLALKRAAEALESAGELERAKEIRENLAQQLPKEPSPPGEKR
jgi:tetratricopeptide (TPR) repeat protein